MKLKTNTTTTDALLQELIAMLRKSGCRVGTGAEIKNIRAQR